MKNEVKKISFNGGELLGVKAEDGRVYLGVRKACLDIGLTNKQADNEIRKIQDGILYNGNSLKFEVVQTEGNREVNREIFGLFEKFVPMWLAQINLTPMMQKNNPNAVSKLLTYQLNATDTLHEAFMATEESKQSFYEDMGLQGEIAHMNGKLDAVDGKVDKLASYITINSHQAQQLFKAGKDKVSQLLGGAKSSTYKKMSKTYFKNMWIQFCEKFGVTSYKDLSPLHIEDGYLFLTNWSYAD